MPESAEVKLTVDFLNNAMTSKIITNWIFTSGQYTRNIPEGFLEFSESLPLLVDNIQCKGKLIYMTCSNEYKKFYIIHHMRLTGCWRDVEDSFSRWYVELDDGEKIWFHDSRSLGSLQFTTDEKELLSILEKLGPDILTDDFSIKTWKKLVQEHKNKNITSFLMDQRIMSGCGNYIKAEALYYAKISPLRKVSSLTEKESEKLFEALRIIPRSAYMNKRLKSEDDVLQTEETREIEKFEFQVYGKRQCTRTKTPDGRITYWDDNVQS